MSGENCALVTDAGTPGISDPGEGLVHLCADVNIPMISIPGPCAVVAALALSGLDAGRFTFEGFLPAVRKRRLEDLRELTNEKRTMVFFEAPHKLLRLLTDMLEVFGDRRIAISRELTKIYEETLRFTLSEAITHFTKSTPRGEFVLVVEGMRFLSSPDICIDGAVTLATSYISSGLSVKDAVKKAADESGIPKNALYNAVIKER
jgi:16S rRNA (cytidine1402-2'-O)-methyltransferase